MCGGQAEDPRELWFPSNLSAGRRRPVSQRQGRQAQRHPSYSLSEQFRPQWIGRGPAHTGGPPALLSWQFECASHPETPSQTHPGCLARWAPSQVIHRPLPQSGASYKWEGAKGPPLHPPSLQTVPPPARAQGCLVWGKPFILPQWDAPTSLEASVQTEPYTWGRLPAMAQDELCALAPVTSPCAWSVSTTAGL